MGSPLLVNPFSTGQQIQHFLTVRPDWFYHLLVGQLCNFVAARKAELDRKSATIESKLPKLTLRSVNQAKEKGASRWLSVLPLKDQVQQGNQRLGIEFPMWSSVLNLTHALNCEKGSFVIIRYDESMNFNADLLKKACDNVQVEPQLQPLNGEQVSSGSVTGDVKHI